MLASRTALPVDETRYLAVAWEMWQRGDFLVPFKNGEAYSHKPPLLFWLFHAGWAVFGVNDLWPRLLSPLLALATLAVTARIAAALWPDAPWRAERSAWILLGCLVFAVFAEMVMFDMLLALCVSIGVLGLVNASRAPGRGFALLAVAIGGGVLAKGRWCCTFFRLHCSHRGGSGSERCDGGAGTPASCSRSSAERSSPLPGRSPRAFAAARTTATRSSGARRRTAWSTRSRTSARSGGISRCCRSWPRRGSSGCRSGAACGPARSSPTPAAGWR
ncbi:MAG: glycosyltransferase family 39 protein [Betaproteobacteria bacterium]|nr:glycosyltransferase family 39 protein [Betaproteobacteria bacterium]